MKNKTVYCLFDASDSCIIATGTFEQMNELLDISCGNYMVTTERRALGILSKRTKKEKVSKTPDLDEIILETRARTTDVILTVETYGTEVQRNNTISKIEDELLTKGFSIKIKKILN